MFPEIWVSVCSPVCPLGSLGWLSCYSDLALPCTAACCNELPWELWVSAAVPWAWGFGCGKQSDCCWVLDPSMCPSVWGHDPRRDPQLLRGIPRSSSPCILLCSSLGTERASIYKARRAQMAGISSAGQSSTEVFVNINKQMQPGSEALEQPPAAQG